MFDLPKYLPVAALGLLSFATPSHAALLAYEGFDANSYTTDGSYPANALFDNAGNGKNPLSHGFTNPWIKGDDVASAVYYRVENSQLSYPGLTTTPGQVNIHRSPSSTGSPAKRAERTLSIGNSTNYGSSLYVAGMIQPTSATAFSVRLAYTGGGTRYVEFSVNAAGITSLFGSGVTVDPSTTSGFWNNDGANFFVLKLENAVLSAPGELHAGDRLSLYVNPDLSSEQLNEPALQFGTETTNFFVTGNAEWSLTRLILGGSPAPGQSVIFDELKIATDWADLSTVIPEPGSVLLALAGLIPLLRRRR